MMAEATNPDTTPDRPLVIMTGCSGLIGTRLLRELSPDYRLVGVDIVEPDEFPGDAEWAKCDLTEDESVRKTIEDICDRHGGQVASVVHLAAFYDFSGEPNPLYRKLTVEGTRRLIQALRPFDVEQFIFSSSLLVMKPAGDERQRITEFSPTFAAWPYPQSKLEAEKVLEQEHGEIPVVVLRMAGVYDEQGHSLPITNHIKRIYEKRIESLMFPGETDHGQPFVHLDDLAACVRQAVDKRSELEDYELFLVAEPDVMSQEELQDRLGELIHGRQWPTIRVPKPVAKVGAWAKDKLTSEEQFIKPWMIDLADDHYPVEIKRAETRLGWRPAHRLRDTLDEIVAGLKRDPRRWYEINNLPMPSELQEAGGYRG